jgi:hypothetical protein
MYSEPSVASTHVVSPLARSRAIWTFRMGLAPVCRWLKRELLVGLEATFLVPLRVALGAPDELPGFGEPVVPDGTAVVVADGELLADEERARRHRVRGHHGAGGEDLRAGLDGLAHLLLGHRGMVSKRTIDRPLALRRRGGHVGAEDDRLAVIPEGLEGGEVAEDPTGSPEQVVLERIRLVEAEAHADLREGEEVQNVHRHDARELALDAVVEELMVVDQDEVGGAAERELPPETGQLDERRGDDGGVELQRLDARVLRPVEALALEPVREVMAPLRGLLAAHLHIAVVHLPLDFPVVLVAAEPHFEDGGEMGRGRRRRCSPSASSGPCGRRRRPA